MWAYRICPVVFFSAISIEKKKKTDDTGAIFWTQDLAFREHTGGGVQRSVFVSSARLCSGRGMLSQKPIT